jgi:hypothetical protein
MHRQIGNDNDSQSYVKRTNDPAPWTSRHGVRRYEERLLGDQLISRVGPNPSDT